MAVPAPSRTAASAQAVNVSVAAIQASAAPWSSMPRDDERFAAVAVGDRPGRELAEAEGGVGEGEHERCRPQPVLRGEGAGGGGGAGDGEVAGGLVETHGQAAAVRAGEVDFHDDGGGPGQALVDAEQDVGGDDPGPRRRPDDHEGYR